MLPDDSAPSDPHGPTVRSDPAREETLDAEPDARDAVGTGDGRLGEHRVLGLLGAGGMGQVLEVEDDQLRRRVAAKVARAGASPASLAKFVQEAQITGQLEHPNIVPVYALGQTADGEPYYTMKRVQGRTLSQLLKADDGRGLVSLLGIFTRVCDALALAHSRHVIHRDLKPANIMVGAFGEVLVMDWGLAKVLTDGPAEVSPAASREIPTLTPDTIASRTLDGEVRGTIAYMPPEQARGELDRIDQRADIYALGAILYEILTRQAPVQGDNVFELLLRIGDGTAYVPPSERSPDAGVPWELEAVVSRAMASDPDARYATVRALRADVEAFMEGRVLAAAEYTTGQRVRKWIGRHRTAVAAALAVALLGAGSAVAAFVGIARQRDRAEGQRDRARRAEREARDNEQRARRSEAALRSTVADLRLMADDALTTRLDHAVREDWLTVASEPARRAVVERLTHLLGEYEGLLQRAAGYEQALADLQARGRKRVRTGASRAPEWTYDDPDDRARAHWLQSTLDGLRPLRSGSRPGIARLRSRRAALQRLRRDSVEAQRAAWDAVIREIADPAVCPAYAGLRLQPQLGLVPLGRDPRSGLHEFAHLGSGDVPRRGPGGRLVLGPASAIVLVLLPGGTVRLGARRPAVGESPTAPHVDALARPEEGPVHRLRLAPFMIAKHELTQGQWMTLFDGWNPSRVRPPAHRRHPVEGLSWKGFSVWVPNARLRLPSEAQWEYAARAGTTTPWSTGAARESLKGAANLADRTYRERNAGRVRFEPWLDDGHSLHAPVGSFRPNAFGLHDVHGNVGEVCVDSYITNAYRLTVHPDGRGTRRWPKDEVHKLKGTRVLRGASAWMRADRARCAARTRLPEPLADHAIGVRPVHPLTPLAPGD